jgi:hypothetical protein
VFETDQPSRNCVANQENERKLKLDESCIADPKSEISNWTQPRNLAVQSAISDFGFEMQYSSNFNFPVHTRTNRRVEARDKAFDYRCGSV